jgi:peptidyl-prolyl cis-trans isomerase C
MRHHLCQSSSVLPIWAAVAGLALAFGLQGCRADQSEPPAVSRDRSEVVATVDGEPIQLGDLLPRIGAAHGQIDPATIEPVQWQTMLQAALDTEITDRLLHRAARLQGWTVDRERLEASLQRTREMLGEEGYAEMLTARGATEDDFREFLATRQLVDRYRATLFADLKLTDEDLESYYSGHRESFEMPESVRLATLAVGDTATADVVVRRLQAGEERVQVGASIEGAELRTSRWMPYDALPEELESEVRAAQAGESVGPVRTGDSFLVVTVLDKRDAGLLPFDEAREDIRQRLLRLRQDRILSEWAEAQRQFVPVETHLDLGPPTP